MAEKFVVFKPNTDYKGENVLPSAGNFQDYNITKFINSLYSKQIAKWKVAIGTATETIYTVPVGKIFILQTAYMQTRQRLVNPASGDQILETTDPEIPKLIEFGMPYLAAGQGGIMEEISLSFPFGMVFKAGTVFKITAFGDYASRASVIGFELPEKQL